MYPKNGTDTAKAVLVNIVLQVNASVVNRIYIGNLQRPIKATYANKFMVSTVFVSKLYTMAGVEKPSNPLITPPTTN